MIIKDRTIIIVFSIIMICIISIYGLLYVVYILPKENICIEKGFDGIADYPSEAIVNGTKYVKCIKHIQESIKELPLVSTERWVRVG